MFANERYAAIAELLEKQSSITVAELMELFGVSIETVRRDLAHLEKQQALSRVHGGAVSKKQRKPFAKLETRIAENKAMKTQLADIAARYINEHDTIAIDSGSTAMELAAVIKKRFRRLTIITNSPEVFGCFSDAEGFELIQIGGRYLKDERAFYGHLALDAIHRLHYSKAFIFPSAISLKNGASEFVHELFEIQRAYMRNAGEVFMLADSTKFETAATIKLCDLSPSFKIITDSQLPGHVLALYQKQSLQIINH
ncbi:DeoR/GlpR transcriptional regulator [Paenibacillus rhizovicinus]|uniref:DeoR/GlpR transcriptional regulator n=1 Tax=Paenibacillus rhizovicinus TaxID=2704463 RepID=A0A6C0P2L8_9BACL|nr:DeoR/GlpR family DNA-binding transcription regulator [Paenibacillus rhizovicinus]QHW32083.1 DeoR/GlpR transcriptional regulator [Paenibacillus rhizovicinus]